MEPRLAEPLWQDLVYSKVVIILAQAQDFLSLLNSNRSAGRQAGEEYLCACIWMAISDPPTSGEGPLPFQIVVAVSKNGGIGKVGRLPWSLPGDLKYFRELTSKTSSKKKQNAVIMGRKTWESIPEKVRRRRKI